MVRFEQELAGGWEYDEDPVADHPFGAYYHWCALLCGFSEAALEHGLLSTSQLDAIRRDLEASLPGLRACRQLLVVIPASLEEHRRIADLLRDDEMLGRLHRLHRAFGEALREQQMSRELDLLDPERRRRATWLPPLRSCLGDEGTNRLRCLGRALNRHPVVISFERDKAGVWDFFGDRSSHRQRAERILGRP
jgi:hypothetical protein